MLFVVYSFFPPHFASVGVSNFAVISFPRQLEGENETGF